LNANNWRLISLIVATTTTVTYFFPTTKNNHGNGLSATAFLLEVLGGAGAVWGFAEISGFRTHFNCADTYPFWRTTTCCILFLFLIRYVIKYQYKCCYTEEFVSSNIMVVERIVSSFILEVIGGVGAVWAFSEIFYLRQGWSDVHFGQPSFMWWRYWVMQGYFYFVCACGFQMEFSARSPTRLLS
jgi:hypothetical protein